MKQRRTFRNSKSRRFRATRILRAPRTKALAVYDAKEPIDLGQSINSTQFSVDAAKYGASIAVQDLNTWDQWNSAKADILKSKFKLVLAAGSANVNFGASLVLVQYVGEKPNDRLNLAGTESIGQNLATQFAGCTYKYRVLQTKTARIVPATSDGSYLAILELNQNMDKLWKQLEKFAAEKTGMGLLPSNAFGLWLVVKSNPAAATIRIFPSYEKRFKFRAEVATGL